MEETNNMCENKSHCCKPHHKAGGACGGVYGLGVLGAAVYFIGHATTFWLGVLGVIKAFFWPALIIYRVLELLKF